MATPGSSTPTLMLGSPSSGRRSGTSSASFSARKRAYRSPRFRFALAILRRPSWNRCGVPSGRWSAPRWRAGNYPKIDPLVPYSQIISPPIESSAPLAKPAMSRATLGTSYGLPFAQREDFATDRRCVGRFQLRGPSPAKTVLLPIRPRPQHPLSLHLRKASLAHNGWM